MPVTLLGLRPVIYPAPDLAAATTWWTDLLGFPPYFQEPFYVGFEVAGYELGLLPDADPDLGATVHTAPTEVGHGIVTATVTTPQGTITGFIVNPHFTS